MVTLYRSTQIRILPGGVLIEKTLFRLDNLTLKHGRWGFDVMVNGRVYDRVHFMDTTLYHFPYNGTVAPIVKVDKVVAKVSLPTIDGPSGDYSPYFGE